MVVRSTASRAALRCLGEVGRGAQQQRAAVLAAEHAGEDAEALGHRDLVDDLAAGRDPDAARADLVGRPDVPLGVERAAVGRRTASWPSVSSSVVNAGVGATCAHTRRSLSEPSASIVNAV